MAAGTSGTLTISGICGKAGGPSGIYAPASYYISNGGSTQSITNNASIQNPTITSPIFIKTPVSNTVQQYCGAGMPDILTGYIKSATGSEIFYLVTLTNTGNITDKFTFSTTATGVNLYSYIETILGAPLAVTPWIAPQGTYSFIVRFVSPTGTIPETTNNTNLTTTSYVCGTTSTTPITTIVYGGKPPTGEKSDLQISNTASPDPVMVGNNFVYTITVVNGLPGEARDITIKDTLPSTLTYISSTTTYGTTSNYNEESRTITARKESQNQTDDPIVIKVTVKPNCEALPFIVNRAVVSCSTTITIQRMMNVLLLPR